MAYTYCRSHLLCVWFRNDWQIRNEVIEYVPKNLRPGDEQEEIL